MRCSRAVSMSNVGATVAVTVLRMGALVTLLAGCGLEETWYQENLDTMVAHDGFEQINKLPYPSALGPPGIDLWVDPAGAAAYRKIDPGVDGSHASVPRGTMIVRAVFDDAGVLTKLTLMAKGPAGYDPTLGDWWFGVTDPDGTPIIENGAPMLGPLAACHECHLARAQDDFLFGVPAAQR